MFLLAFSSIGEGRGGLNVKAEVHDVAVLHNIFFSFDAELSSLAYSSLGAILDIVFVFYDLCADESFLEVCVDYAGTLWCLPSFVVGPCLYFHFACGDECLKVKQRVGFLDKTVHAAFLQSQFVEKHLLVLVSLQTGNVFLCLSCNDEGFCAFLFCNLLDAL